jgi:hypothetical protein
VTVADERPADLITVHPGQITVQDHHVITRSREVGKRVAAIEDDVDRHALASQARRHRHRQLRVVFNQQHPHRPLPRHRSHSAGPGQPRPARDVKGCPIRGNGGVTT